MHEDQPPKKNDNPFLDYMGSDEFDKNTKDPFEELVESDVFDRTTNLKGLESEYTETPEGDSLIQAKQEGTFTIASQERDWLFPVTIEKIVIDGKKLERSFQISISWDAIADVVEDITAGMTSAQTFGKGYSLEVFHVAKDLLKDFIQRNGLIRGFDRSVIGTGAVFHCWFPE